MTIYTYKITEYSLVGSTDRELTVKARTEKSALKKLIQIRGNRTWDYSLVKVTKE